MTGNDPMLTAYTVMAIGCAMVMAELFVTSFGLLGIGGLALFTWGASTIFDHDAMMIVWAIDGAALFIMACIGVVLWRARNKPVIGGTEGMIGKDAEIVEWADHTGMVKIQGELWKARSTHGTVFHVGESAVVGGSDNEELILHIRKD